jgi:hypothetical protein
MARLGVTVVAILSLAQLCAGQSDYCKICGGKDGCLIASHEAGHQVQDEVCHLPTNTMLRTPPICKQYNGVWCTAAKPSSGRHLVTLKQLQGGGSSSSPFRGKVVTVRGQVTGVASRGFFIQDASAYGVYVYDRSRVRVGDHMQLTGKVAEYHGLTELTLLSVHQRLPGFPPHGKPTPVKAQTGHIGERHEGTLVEVVGTCVNPDIGHGEWLVDDGTGSAVVDDVLTRSSSIRFDTKYRVTGIGHFSYGKYKLEALKITAVGAGGLPPGSKERQPSKPPPAPPAKGANDQCPKPPRMAFDHSKKADVLRIGSMNAEWLFDGIDDTSPSPWNAGSKDCAGLSNGLNHCNMAGATKHLQRVAQVVARLDADILNMVEVEGCKILGRLCKLLPLVRRAVPPPHKAQCMHMN